MTPRQRELARHAIGLPNDKRQSYRNRFIAGRGHVDFADWMAMVNDGHAVKRDMAGPNYSFHLTHKAATQALEPGERLDREDFPEKEAT